MAAEKVAETSSLVYAPTWAVASVCFVFILCSLLVERLIFALGQFWRSRKKTALVEALEKIKEELMVVGFISLALAVGASYVAKICVPKDWTNFMPQCKPPKELEGRETLAAPSTSGQQCADKGKADFISYDSLHQLHIFLFCLAVVHVVYSVITMALGMWKVRQWKTWEEEAEKIEIASDHGGLRYAKDASFIKRHAVGKWSKNIVLSHISAFFQQFYQSVSSTDYLTLRHGFIRNHNLQNFDFHKYILKSLEKDINHVVGISVPLWGYMVILMLVNVEGWGTLYWASIVPFIVVLAVGTKLRHIITQMAIRCLNKHAVIERLPAVKPSDDLFWFKRPKLILSLIHFILFQDAFDVAVHLWSRFTFNNEPNCFNQKSYVLAGRLTLGLIAQVLCGCVVLPIYALVSQMGSHMKEHGDMELCVRVHDDKSRNPTEVSASNEGSTTAHSITQLHGAEAGNRDMDGKGGEDSIVEVNDKLHRDLCSQRKMSYIERVARRVPGESYNELKSSAAQAGHAPI